MSIVVFLGPTMPLAAARSILPDARYLPPARQADLLSVVRNDRPDVVALIDGVFHQSLSVWHKEVLDALSRGVHIYGSSSMGALRAAECAAFGMVGVGRIYEAFASGELTDDDEVALAHGDGESGWRNLSEAMVNVRATLTEAVRRGVIDESTEQSLIGATKARYFPNRTWEAIYSDAEQIGGATLATELRGFVAEHRVDQKRLDAEELLGLLADLPDQLPPLPPIEVNNSHVFAALRERDRRVERDGAVASFEEIGRYVMLHRSDAPEVLARALDRELALSLARFVNLELDDEAVADEMERFRVRRRLENDDALAGWLDRNDMDADDLDELVYDLAVCRRLRQWLTVRRYKLGLTRPLLDQLRLEGDYERWADEATQHETFLERTFSSEQLFDVDDDEVLELMQSHARETGWRPDTDIYTWADEAGFGQAYDVLVELKRASLARRLGDGEG